MRDYTAAERRSKRMSEAVRRGSHTAREWTCLQIAFDVRCVRCGVQYEVTKDHIVPVSEGGCNCIANVQPLCRSCNSLKGTADQDFRCGFDPDWAREYHLAMADWGAYA